MQAEDGGRAVERLGFFSDAVFAVVLVLLANQVALPLVGTPSDALHDALGDAAPQLMGFAISFATIAVLWVDQHRLFDYLRSRNEPLLWGNLALLLCVAFLVYPAGTFAEHTGAPVAALFFAGSLMVTALVSAALWWYATGSRSVAVELDLETRVRLVQRPLSTAAVFVVSAPFVLVGLKLGEFELTLASIVWIAGLVAVRVWFLRSAWAD